MKEYTRDIMTYKEYMKYATGKILESKQEWRRIKVAKKSGIKNPYAHFINDLPKNLQNITKMKVS